MIYSQDLQKPEIYFESVIIHKKWTENGKLYLRCDFRLKIPLTQASTEPMYQCLQFRELAARYMGKKEHSTIISTQTKEKYQQKAVFNSIFGQRTDFFFLNL